MFEQLGSFAVWDKDLSLRCVILMRARVCVCVLQEGSVLVGEGHSEGVSCVVYREPASSLCGSEGQRHAAAQLCGCAAGRRTEAEILHRHGRAIPTGDVKTLGNFSVRLTVYNPEQSGLHFEVCVFTPPENSAALFATGGLKRREGWKHM